MSPILVRPVREQLEHDRIIRLLHGKSRRKYDAGMNPGAEQNAPVGVGPSAVFPDLVLHSQERGRRLEVIVEVETGESVNTWRPWPSGRVSPEFAPRFTSMYLPGWLMSRVDCARTTRSE